VLWGIFGGYILSCRLDLAAAPASRVLSMATRAGEGGYQCLAHRMLGVLAVHRGDFPLGRTHLEQAVRDYDPELYRPLAFRYGGDIQIISQLYLAGMECFEDKREEAYARADAALAEAHAMNHALSIGQAYAYCCYARFYFGDVEGALDLADLGHAFCSKANIAVFAFIFRIVTAWGQRQDAPVIRQMMGGYADAGGVIGLPLFSTMLAEVLLAQGESEAAVTEMRGALEAVRRTGELFFEPLVLQVLGECLLAEARLDEAQICLEEALAAAGRMGAALFERRARKTLASLGRPGTAGDKSAEFL